MSFNSTFTRSWNEASFYFACLAGSPAQDPSTWTGAQEAGPPRLTPTTAWRRPSAQPIAIAGHTDSVGRPEANQALSENRANAVRKWLTSQGGVPAARISTRGCGHSQPGATNDTAEGRQKDRRVEIKVQKE